MDTNGNPIGKRKNQAVKRVGPGQPQARVLNRKHLHTGSFRQPLTEDFPQRSGGNPAISWFPVRTAKVCAIAGAGKFQPIACQNTGQRRLRGAFRKKPPYA